jgi:DNA-directed RNA polymerase subunit RPC12/RpoP
MTLKSLEYYERERREYYDSMRQAMRPHPNGIACPKCGRELWDSSPSITLTSDPPQKNIHCPACGYRGYALR